MECPLAAANESRRRAWQEFKRLRAIVSLLAELPPAAKPPCFEAEGKLLREALLRALIEAAARAETLDAALKKIRPFISNVGDSAEFPHALMSLNRAAGMPGLRADALARLRALGQQRTR